MVYRGEGFHSPVVFMCGRLQHGFLHTLKPLLCLSLVSILICGCASFGRGVVQGVLESQGREREDTRVCSVDGEPFDGIAPLLERQHGFGDVRAADPQRPQLNVIYIHGIGTHLPGHGAGLIEGLAQTLSLSVRSKRFKRVELVSPRAQSQKLGELKVLRLTNPERTRDLVYYELTWSDITRSIKESIAFDSSRIFRSRRASLNQALRSFTNDVLPDPLAFAGNKGELIREAVAQTLCWSISTSWNDLPELTAGRACVSGPGSLSRLPIDSHMLVTHSLGSRVAIDSLQAAARQRGAGNAFIHHEITERLRQKEISIFMLSNQLPLLEAGQDPQEITGQTQAFCGESAPQANERFLKGVNLIAFSDPNDLFSYPAPQAWADKHLDSRLCARITNVNINIAHVISLFGIGEFADPLAAHSGYDQDERVRNLFAHGVGNPHVAPIVKERCSWTEADESLMH